VHHGFDNRLDSVQIRSIDFFPVESEAGLLNFLTKKLDVQFGSAVDKKLAGEGATVLPTYTCTWRLPKAPVTLKVVAAPGQAAGKRGLLLDILSEASGALVRERGIEATVDFQHELVGNAFFDLLTKELRDEIGYSRKGD
jgi:hypothetical protein